MSANIRVGIIGCGGIINNHLPVWLRLKNVKVTAVCDVNKRLAIKTASRFGIPRYYTELHEMLKKENLCILDNCTPVQFHTPLSIEGMESGCHVIVEKPMALSKKDADEMIQTAKKNGVWLFPIHNTLFNPTVVEARSLIAEGGIGEVVGMDVSYFKRRDDSWVVNENHWSHRLPGGIFGEVLAHPIYLELAILGRLKLLSVHMRKFLHLKWIKADELRVMLNGEKGLGRILLSLNSPREVALAKIYGDGGILELGLWDMTMVKHKPSRKGGKWRGIHTLSKVSQELESTLFGLFKVVSGKATSGHYVLLPNFVKVIQGHAEPLVSAEDGRKVAEVLEKITRVIDRG